jgi:hypothetical protein
MTTRIDILIDELAAEESPYRARLLEARIARVRQLEAEQAREVAGPF